MTAGSYQKLSSASALKAPSFPVNQSLRDRTIKPWD